MEVRLAKVLKKTQGEMNELTSLQRWIPAPRSQAATSEEVPATAQLRGACVQMPPISEK